MFGEYIHRSLLAAGWGWDGEVYEKHLGQIELRLEPEKITTTVIEENRRGRWVFRIGGPALAVYRNIIQAGKGVMGEGLPENG